MPHSFFFLFLNFRASSGNTSLQRSIIMLKTCCLMLRVNTSPSWAPTTHTGKPSPWGTDSPLWPLSQERLRTVNFHRETNMGLFHTFPRITLPSWWGLMYTAAGGTSADQAVSFRSHSRPWSIPTQNRTPPPQPRSQPSGLRGLKGPDVQWGIQTGISWAILNILELWTNTNYLKGNLWSEGTKHVCREPYYTLLTKRRHGPKALYLSRKHEQEWRN